MAFRSIRDCRIAALAVAFDAAMVAATEYQSRYEYDAVLLHSQDATVFDL